MSPSALGASYRGEPSLCARPQNYWYETRDKTHIANIHSQMWLAHAINQCPHRAMRLAGQKKKPKHASQHTYRIFLQFKNYCNIYPQPNESKRSFSPPIRLKPRLFAGHDPAHGSDLEVIKISRVERSRVWRCFGISWDGTGRVGSDPEFVITSRVEWSWGLEVVGI